MSEHSAGSPETVDGFFVYGTLKRGQCRERAWRTKPLAIHQAWTSGCLYGRDDYPALTVPADASLHHRVLGEFWQFAADQMVATAAVLDIVEGTRGNSPGDLYHRQLVPVHGLDDAHVGWAITYIYNQDLQRDGFVLVLPESGTQTWPAIHA